MIAEAANNMSFAAALMMGTTAMNVISVILLVYAARMNLKTSRLMAEVAKLRAAQGIVTRQGHDREDGRGERSE